MAKRRRKRNRHNNPSLTHAAITERQRRDRIPGGSVNPHREARDEIGIEDRDRSDKGAVLTTGQIVITAVRKLLQADRITLDEAHAAQLFQRDFDIAYASCINPLAAVQVDHSGAGTGAMAAMRRKAYHGQRYNQARAWLGQKLARFADALIIGNPDCGIEPTFTGVGAEVRPDGSKKVQLNAGHDAGVEICQELGAFYATGNQARSRHRIPS